MNLCHYCHLDLHSSLTFDLESDLDMKLAEGAGNPPRVGLLVLIVQWLDLLLFLGFTEFGRVGEFEELRRKFDEPACVDGRHFAHVLLGGEDELVVHNPAAANVQTWD